MPICFDNASINKENKNEMELMKLFQENVKTVREPLNSLI